MTTTLVSGGAGFIGSWLCERLIADGDTVIAMDNFATGSRRNLSNLEGHPRFRLVEHDVTTALPDVGPVDQIFHMASPASPDDYRRLSIETLLVNSAGTHQMLELARQHGAKFLVASTSESYGDPQVHPQVETYWGHVNPVGDRSCYDEAKRFAEAITMSYLRRYDLDARIIRIFNTYGPRMRLDDGRVVPNFIGQALRGEPLTIYGNGEQTRSFCFVSDLVEGIVRALRTPGTKGEVINLGNATETTIRQFGEAVCTLMGVPLRVEGRPLPPDDPARRCPDLAKAKRLLDWGPVVPLEAGLQATSDYFRTQLEVSSACG
jgi:nucleoside-diphosphate-sugar epimerase